MKLSTEIFRWIIGVCTAISLGLIVVSLACWGAREVRNDFGEAIPLIGAGGVWLLCARCLFPWLGLDIRDDALERKNAAALISLCAALLAVAIIYAGGNLGEGPSISENFFSAGLGTAVWFLQWLLLELGARVSVSIAEERDLAAGIRLAGFLLASGGILGRAIAGDWHSASATLFDCFHDGWPVAILLIIALPVEWLLRPSRRNPFPNWPACGLIPALAYLILAGIWLRHLGPWEGMPK